MGDLQALYAGINDLKDVANDMSSRQLDKSSPWSKLFSDKVLPELTTFTQARSIDDARCSGLRSKRGRRIIAHCFKFWRSTLIRAMKSDLLTSIESNNTSYFKQRKSNILKVWGHVALGLNSRKKILERRQDGTEKAREALIITPEMVDAEIRRFRMRNTTQWLSGYSQRTYFKLWRDSIGPYKENVDKSKKYVGVRICSAVLSSWLEVTRASIDQAEGNFSIDYRRLAEAKAFHHRNATKFIMRRWGQYSTRMASAQLMRRRVLSRLVRGCLKEWNQLKISQRKIKQNALSHWMDVEQVYLKQPFYCWRAIVATNKYKAFYEERMLATHLRAAGRKKLYKHFRQWLHQTRYCRVTSLYTRNELASGWVEQKRMSEQLWLQIEGMKSQLESYDELQSRLKSIEEKLIISERARFQAEKSLEEMKCMTRINHMCQESVLALFPLFNHKNNVI